VQKLVIQFSPERESHVQCHQPKREQSHEKQH
jgi:hypothetical protein